MGLVITGTERKGEATVAPTPLLDEMIEMNHQPRLISIVFPSPILILSFCPLFLSAEPILIVIY